MLTIVIPTFNRPRFICRLLKYYSDLKINFHIVVADSSPVEKQISSYAASLAASGLNIDYRIFPSETPYIEKLLSVFKGVDSKYITLGADDDFFVPRMFADAINFLDTHTDYSIFHGEAIVFSIDGDDPVHGRSIQVGSYPQRGIERSTGAQRLLDGMSSYTTTWYSIHRTHLFLENFTRVSKLTDDYLFLELILSNLDAIQGKINKADRLYMARQVDYSGSVRNYETPSTVFDWLIGAGWSHTYDKTAHFLAEELAKYDSLDHQEALLVVRDAYLQYLSYYLPRSGFRSKVSGRDLNLKNGFRNAIGRMPVIRAIWNNLKPLFKGFLPEKFGGSPGKASTAALLGSTSKYHQDFMPIYQAVTNLSAEYLHEVV
jgi:glycosyltransferase domain-containing protein